MSQEILDLATNALAMPISAAIFVNGLEEIAMDVQYFARGLHKRERRAITQEELAAAPPRRIAVMVPAWHEAEVIENMLERNRRSLDYDPALFDIFCGTYQNDLATQECVAAVVRRHHNIHKVVVPHDGPTSKADCLNWIYQGIVLEENRRGRRFDILLMQDAEDVIHPFALRLYSLLIPTCEFVQTPVFSLPLGTRKLVAATYIDEFAEHHLKDMMVREAIGGFVPSAGVGSAFARDAFEDIALAHDQQPFNVESLTEDYEIGLRFRLAGKRVHFACRSLQRTRTVPRRLFRGERRVVDEEIIATREFFPSGFSPSVRQRARWITGITLQAWRQIGWQGPAAVRYCLWRDRKAVVTNLLLVGAYFLFALTGARVALTSADMGSIISPHSLVWWLMAGNLLLLVWRAAMKMRFVGSLYGLAHALASAPRLIVANLIGLTATARAIRQYTVHVVTGKPLRWCKTAHEYPSFEVLASHQCRLGELLIAKGQLAAADVDTALRLQEGTDLRLGEVIVASGMLSAGAVVRALGEALVMPTVEPKPDDVPHALLWRVSEPLAAELGAMPVAIEEDGRTVIAMSRPPRADEVDRLIAAAKGPVRVALAERDGIRRTRWRAYRRLVETDPDRPHERLGAALVARGVIARADLDAALAEQLETRERLGELLIRLGSASPEAIARALPAPRLPYRTIAPAEIDVRALRKIGHGLAGLYQLAPVCQGNELVVACPFPIHPVVLEEVARRTGRARVAAVLAPGRALRVALAMAGREAWPERAASRVLGFAGEELTTLLDDAALAGEVANATGVATHLGVSPIDHLETTRHISCSYVVRLRARALGLAVATLDDCRCSAAGVLPPELVVAHHIHLYDADARGLVLAAPRPTPRLAHQVAELFIERAIAWRVLARPEHAFATIAPHRMGMEII
jgi:adsorption protein B